MKFILTLIALIACFVSTTFATVIVYPGETSYSLPNILSINENTLPSQVTVSFDDITNLWTFDSNHNVNSGCSYVSVLTMNRINSTIQVCLAPEHTLYYNEQGEMTFRPYSPSYSLTADGMYAVLEIYHPGYNTREILPLPKEPVQSLTANIDDNGISILLESLNPLTNCIIVDNNQPYIPMVLQISKSKYLVHAPIKTYKSGYLTCNNEIIPIPSVYKIPDPVVNFTVSNKTNEISISSSTPITNVIAPYYYTSVCIGKLNCTMPINTFPVNGTIANVSVVFVGDYAANVFTRSVPIIYNMFVTSNLEEASTLMVPTQQAFKLSISSNYALDHNRHYNVTYTKANSTKSEYYECVLPAGNMQVLCDIPVNTPGHVFVASDTQRWKAAFIAPASNSEMIAVGHEFFILGCTIGAMLGAALIGWIVKTVYDHVKSTSYKSGRVAY